MTLEEHTQALRALITKDHEDSIAELQRRAGEAAAAGKPESQRWYLESLDRLKAIPLPWEKNPSGWEKKQPSA